MHLQGGGIIIASGAGQGLDRVMVKEAAAIVRSSPKVRLRPRALAERADGLWGVFGYVLGKGPESYIRQAKYLLQFNEAYNIIWSELLEGGLNVYICSRLLHMSELWLTPLAEI